MHCVSRDREMPQKRPVDYCVGCEEGNPQAFNKCIKNKGGIKYTFFNGTKIIILNKN